MEWVYLDNNATTRPAPQVTQAVVEMYERLWANPSSVHRFGQMARHRVELARAAVASLIGSRDREIVFTSGGTESNNLALFGALAHAAKPVLITTMIEHSAVREPAAALDEMGTLVVHVPIDSSGRVDPQSLKDMLNRFARECDVVMVSIHWVNNETGVVAPIEALAQVVHDFRMARQRDGSRTRVLFHTDATQAVGKLPIDVGAVRVDLMTLSGHKFHGPKGVGALFVRQGVRLLPQNRGGPQERDRRGGTENTPAIVGMGVAAELAEAFAWDDEAIAQCRARRDRFERSIVEALPGTLVNSSGARRIWNTSNLAFPRLEAEAILLGLSERGVCASAGAACSSGSLEPSPVLLAMGIPEEAAHGSVRFSISRETTDDDIDKALPIVIDVVRRLRETLPV